MDPAQLGPWQRGSVFGQQPGDGELAMPILAIAGHLKHGQPGGELGRCLAEQEVIPIP
jgi:hypothetical protein